MEKFTPLGNRLLSAFNTNDKTEIAKILGYKSNQGVYKVLSGERELDFEKLQKFKNYTKRSIDWLLTGEEDENDSPFRINPALMQRLRTIAGEQAQIVYGDADVAGNLEGVTLHFLTEYLLYRALVSFNLIDAGDALTPAERKRAERFTFVANIPQSVDDRIAEIVERKFEKERFTLDTRDEMRDMIRDIVNEELTAKTTHRLRPVKIDDEEITGARKAG